MTKSNQLIILFLIIVNTFACIVQAKVFTNQTMIENLSAHNSLKSKDIDSVFDMILTNTSDKLVIYPTEGYYYFWFYQQGNLIRGNIRFSYDLIDNNQLSFAYYHDIQGKGGSQSNTYHKIYNKEDNLKLNKVDEKTYQMIYKNHTKTIYFDIPKSNYVKNNSEIFLGDMRDESGVVFTLVYNTVVQQFFYILDQSKNYEYHYKISDHLSVGSRTGFVYFQFKHQKILVGVNEYHTQINSFFDGPFDQLPDYYLGQSNFKQLVENHYPQLKGKIDTHGKYLDDFGTRVAIDNYLQYKSLNEFESMARCQLEDLECVQESIVKKSHLHL